MTDNEHDAVQALFNVFWKLFYENRILWKDGSEQKTGRNSLDRVADMLEKSAEAFRRRKEGGKG